MHTRRSILIGSAGLAAGGAIAVRPLLPRYRKDPRPLRSRVAILRAHDYSDKLERLLMDGLRLFALDLRNRSVLLKPNLVEYLAGAPINTHPRLVGAAAEVLLRLGAARVVVAEGPGHHRDTELLVEESGLGKELRSRKIRFIDLNRDELAKVPLRANYTGLDHLWLPRAVLACDFVVSMPKVKTHHWAGVTLSMKNMFGIVPGTKYGWPKNLLHWRGIQQSILDVCATVRPSFVIADAIVAMEGNGPLHGAARQLGLVVLSDDPVAADTTCACLMGFEPLRVVAIREASRFLGHSSARLIDQVGERIVPASPSLEVLPEFRYLASAPAL